MGRAQEASHHSAVLAELRRRLPAGFELFPIDRQLIERCEWRSEMEFYCGSLDNFLLNGMGLCMMQGDEIIVEAFVSPFWRCTRRKWSRHTRALSWAWPCAYRLRFSHPSLRAARLSCLLEL